MKHIVYLALGSNLGCREEYIKNAVQALSQLPDTVVLAVSSLHETAPVGYPDQPDFLNAAAKIETSLSPNALLGAALGIEAALGRYRNRIDEKEKSIKNGPRIIDIDLLLYDNITVNTEELTLPHPRMFEREFVLAPLSEIKKDG